MGRTMRRGARGTAAVAAAALAFAGCGGDDGDSAAQQSQSGGGQATQAAQDGDVERYCQLARQLERNAEQHFSRLGEGTSPTEFRTAHVEFIEANQETIRAIPQAAPAQIRDKIETTLAGMRQQAGEQVDVSEADIEAADRKLKAFEQQRCQGS